MSVARVRQYGAVVRPKEQLIIALEDMKERAKRLSIACLGLGTDQYWSGVVAGHEAAIKKVKDIL